MIPRGAIESGENNTSDGNTFSPTAGDPSAGSAIPAVRVHASGGERLTTAHTSRARLCRRRRRWRPHPQHRRLPLESNASQLRRQGVLPWLPEASGQHQRILIPASISKDGSGQPIDGISLGNTRRLHDSSLIEKSYEIGQFR